MPDRIAPTAFLLAVFAALVTHGCVKAHQDERARQLAARVRTEFLHAWNDYERYAWGHDALRPLSKTGHDWYGQSLLMTPVDALVTLILMHLDSEAERARSLIVSDLALSASESRCIRISVTSASTGVIKRDCPYQSCPVLLNGRNASWPHA